MGNKYGFHNEPSVLTGHLLPDNRDSASLLALSKDEISGPC